MMEENNPHTQKIRNSCQVITTVCNEKRSKLGLRPAIHYKQTVDRGLYMLIAGQNVQEPAKLVHLSSA